MEVIHFNTQEERLRYLKKGYEEIIPKVAEKKPKKRKKKDEVQAE